MLYQNESFRAYKYSKERIIIAAAIFVVCVNLGIMTFLFFSTQDKCTSIDNYTINYGRVLYYKFNNQSQYGENSTFVYDFSGNGNNGKVYGAVWNSKGGKLGEGAFEFDGINDYISVDDANSLSPSTFGQQFTVSFWIRFDKTSFIGYGSEKDYINYLGKGSFDEGYEWIFRQYNSSNAKGRDSRISFYVFNPKGGLGAGSYFQEGIKNGEWIYITGVINGTHIKIYKNGILHGNSALSQYNISMKNGRADFYIGQTEGDNYFKGSIDELSIFNRALNDSQVQELHSLSINGVEK